MSLTFILKFASFVVPFSVLGMFMHDLEALYLTQVRPYFNPTPDDAILNQYDPIVWGELRKKEYVGAEPGLNGPICRFCGLGKDKTTFDLVPHAVPEFLGNTKLIATDECDVCNNKFGGTIESDLANYLGTERILTRMKGKAGLPKEKFRGGSVQEGRFTKLIEVCSRPSSDSIVRDEKLGTITFRKNRAPYIPAGVFKCLTKIALSIMPEEYLDDLSETRAWVEKAHDFRGFIPASAFKLFRSNIYIPNAYPHVHVLLVKRKANVFAQPYMLFQISFGSMIFQIPIFRGAADIPVAGERSLTYQVPVLPCRYSLNPFTKYLIKSEVVCLSRTEKVKDDEQVLVMKYERIIPLDVSNLTLDKGHVAFRAK